MNNIEDIIKQQKEFHFTHNGGVLRDPLDERDFQAEHLMGSNLDAVTIDWDQGYDALADCWSDMPNQNQESQFSCTGRGASAYKQVLQAKDTGEHTLLSAKSIYNPIAMPGQGAYIRSAMMRTINYGVNKETTVPSGGTEQEVTAPMDFTPFTTEASFYKNATVATIGSQDFDTLAKMIYLNHGFVSGWATHCQYFKGYGKLQGKRFLKTHGSYGQGSDMFYFEGETDPLFSIWTALDVKNIQNLPPVLPDTDALLVDQKFGDTGVEVLKLRRALTRLGWIPKPGVSVYDNELANMVFGYQSANLDRLSWSYFWSVWYHGRRVDAVTRENINQAIKFRK